MLNGVKFCLFSRNGLWAKAINTAILLENDLLTGNRVLSPCQQFFGKETRSILSLVQKFGKMCMATHWDNSHQAKLANNGTLGIRVGFAEGHPVGSNYIYNPKTKIISLTKM